MITKTGKNDGVPHIMEYKVQVKVSVPSILNGESVTKNYLVSREEIDDIKWWGGASGDCYFDDMSDDEERFIARLEDTIQGLLYYDDDEQLGGAESEYEGYHERLEFDYELVDTSLNEVLALYA